MARSLVLITYLNSDGVAIRHSDSFETDALDEDMPHEARGQLADMIVNFGYSNERLAALCIPSESDGIVTFIDPATDEAMADYIAKEHESNRERAEEHKAELRMGK